MAPAPGRRIRVGVILPMFSGDPGKVVAAARSAEDLGFDGAFVFDHFFPPGTPADRPSLEAFTSLALVAAATRSVTVGTLVARAVLRPAALVARTAASLEEISAGRLVLGLGTGDPIDRPEHAAFGFPDLAAAERRAHLAETVAAITALLDGRSYPGGRFVPPLEGPLLPRPARPGGPPVWVGGLADDVVRIAGRLADGWNGWGLAPDAFGRKVELLAAEARTAGREAEPTWAGIVLAAETEEELDELLAARRRRNAIDQVSWWGTPDRLAGFLCDLAAAGATWAIMVLAGPAGRRELVAERVLPAL